MREVRYSPYISWKERKRYFSLLRLYWLGDVKCESKWSNLSFNFLINTLDLISVFIILWYELHVLEIIMTQYQFSDRYNFICCSFVYIVDKRWMLSRRCVHKTIQHFRSLKHCYGTYKLSNCLMFWVNTDIKVNSMYKA